MQLLHVVFESLFSLPDLAEARALGPAAPPKCKTVDTRVAALALLAELAEPVRMLAGLTHHQLAATELVGVLMACVGSPPLIGTWATAMTAVAIRRCGQVVGWLNGICCPAGYPLHMYPNAVCWHVGAWGSLPYGRYAPASLGAR